MSTLVLILAQGQQTRLPKLGDLPKQLLRLPACGNETILHRTLRQIPLASKDPGEMVVAVVAGDKIRSTLGEHHRYNAVTLVNPGNSSLRGCGEIFLRMRPTEGVSADRFVVLLGDVVYSWACLDAILNAPRESGVRFVGTSDLSQSGGEIWGLAWNRHASATALAALERALSKHPKQPEYQCGQLRQWLWNMPAQSTDRAAIFDDCYRTIDDYTDDVDVWTDVEGLPALSELAARDDEAHGMTWPEPVYIV